MTSKDIPGMDKCRQSVRFELDVSQKFSNTEKTFDELSTVCEFNGFFNFKSRGFQQTELSAQKIRFKKIIHSH